MTSCAFFLGESKNGFVIEDHMDSSLPKKKDPKKDYLPRQRHILVLLVMRKMEGKNNKLILAAKTRRKSNIGYIRMNIPYVYIFQFET